MLDSRICMEFLLRSILSLHDLRQSQSPEMQGVRLALGPLRYLKPRMGPFFQSEWPLWWVLGFEISMQEPLSQLTILLKLTWVGVEFQKSNEPSVWHKLWSFLWLLVQVWDNLRANFWQFSNGSQFFFFELMVVKAWSCGFVQLLGCSVRQFTISLHTFLCMTLHIMGPWRDVCVRFPEPRTFSFAPAQILDSNIFCNCRQYLHLFRVPLECTPSRRGQEMMLVLPNRFLS